MADNVIVRVPEQQFIRGEDGYSPVVTVEDIEHGHRVTITDREHPVEGQSFDVMDGASAYEQAADGGYSGTEAEFNEELANFKEYAQQANYARSDAITAANTAGSYSSQARQAVNQAQSAMNGAQRAASSASESATSASGSETAAAASATAAAASATEAAASATAAASAKTAAEDAQEAAETAQAAAESARDAAASSATDAAGSATTATEQAQAAATARAAAETAQEAAEQAQSDAETAAQSISQSAAQITQNASDISDLKSAIDNFRDMYPWDINAKLASTIINPQHAEIVKSSILDVHLFGADNREKYYMHYFNRSNDGNSICTIKIAKSDGTEVCGYSQWYHYFPSVERINLNEVNNSGISGFVIVNWSAMPIGTAWSVNATNGFENFGLSEFTISSNDDIEILLPDIIYWCEGREMSVYFENILLCDNLKNYQIDCVGNVGKQQNERFVIDSPVIGDYYLTINVYTANYGRLIITKTTIIHVISNVGTGTDKKVCFIGDSWTDNPRYIADLQALYGDETDTDTLTLIGTRYPWGQYTGAPKTEGRAGWSTRDYALSASVRGVTNAFYNPTSKIFDFSYYLSSTGQSTPDIVSIFLGINDVAKGVLPMKSLEAFDIMISSIKNASSNIKIALALTPPPCQSQDGFGKNSGVGPCYWQQKKGAFNFAKMLYEKYKDDSSIFFVPVMSSVDMFYNVISEEVAPNAYNTDITIRRITDNVHCNNFGYAQVADAFYGCLKHF